MFNEIKLEENSMRKKIDVNVLFKDVFPFFPGSLSLNSDTEINF